MVKVNDYDEELGPADTPVWLTHTETSSDIQGKTLWTLTFKGTSSVHTLSIMTHTRKQLTLIHIYTEQEQQRSALWLTS